MNKIFDLNNKEVKVGDKVVVSDDTNRDSCYLMTGKVIDIKYCEIQTTLTIEIHKQGRWNNDLLNDKAPKHNKIKSYRIPREHCNILVL